MTVANFICLMMAQVYFLLGLPDRLKRRRLVRKLIYHQQRVEYYASEIESYVRRNGPFFHRGLRFFFSITADVVKVAPDERPTWMEKYDSRHAA